MKYTSGKTGRIFVARLEDGDDIYGSIKQIAANEKVDSAAIWIIGGMKNAGLVVGPKEPVTMPPEGTIERFSDPREILAIGTIFKNSENEPSLHLHAGIGKGDKILVGCPRINAECWLVNEVIILEITGCDAVRIKESPNALELLTIGGQNES